MLVGERTSNGGSMGCPAFVCGNGATLNGHAFGSEGLNTDGSSGEYSEYSPEGFRTYKRRRHLRLTAGTNVQENGRVSADVASQLAAQEPGHCHENSLQTNSQLHEDSKVPDRSQNVAKEHENPTSNGSQNEANNQADVHHVTELCQRVLHNVMVSEKFDLLCKLLCESFQGIKVGSLLDFSVINSRMKDGAYEQSPVLFSTDLQQVWHKIQKIGNEMVFLAKGLSDMTHNSYSALVGGSIHGTCEAGKDEEINHAVPEQNSGKGFSVPESDHETKPEQTEVHHSGKIHTCRHCGVKADGKDRLVCDSCEEMYHVSCIEPALEEIPSRSWYCANCTASGIESPHDNCVVCERLNDVRTQTNGSGETQPMEEDMLSELEERSDCSMEAEDGLQFSDGDKKLHHCKLCGIGEEDDQRLRICGHPLCPNKYYHLRCLTNEQLKSYGPRWYCPSCLCRCCLCDEHDDKIVLCDGCDHAYHIYCMKPPRTSIPRGKWFCGQCDAGIQVIRRAKRTYEHLEKQRKKELGGSNEAVGSVDMLLNAAEKLKCEEKLAATRKKR